MLIYYILFFLVNIQRTRDSQNCCNVIPLEGKHVHGPDFKKRIRLAGLACGNPFQVAAASFHQRALIPVFWSTLR